MPPACGLAVSCLVGAQPLVRQLLVCIPVERQLCVKDEHNSLLQLVPQTDCCPELCILLLITAGAAFMLLKTPQPWHLQSTDVQSETLHLLGRRLHLLSDMKI